MMSLQLIAKIGTNMIWGKGYGLMHCSRLQKHLFVGDLSCGVMEGRLIKHEPILFGKFVLFVAGTN
jgi:hypothetical protein